MIAHGAFGKSKFQNVMENPPVLTEAGIAKASRNRKIFNRAMALLMKDYEMTREDLVNWLDDDKDQAWLHELPENENSA